MTMLIVKLMSTVHTSLGISAFFNIGNGPKNGNDPNKKNKTVCFVRAVSTDKFVNRINDSNQSL